MKNLPDYQDCEFKVEGSFPIYKITMVSRGINESTKYEEVEESSMICDCPKNYGRACKKPDKYKTGGCK